VIVKELELKNNKTNLLTELTSLQLDEETNVKKITFSESVGTMGCELGGDEYSHIDSRVGLKEKAKKLIIILMGAAVKKGNKGCLEQLSLKTIHSRINLINSPNDVRSLILDCVPNLPPQWEQLMSYVVECGSFEDKEVSHQIQ
jgi:hypothetical protein